MGNGDNPLRICLLMLGLIFVENDGGAGASLTLFKTDEDGEGIFECGPVYAVVTIVGDNTNFLHIDTTTTTTATSIITATVNTATSTPTSHHDDQPRLQHQPSRQLRVQQLRSSWQLQVRPNQLQAIITEAMSAATTIPTFTTTMQTATTTPTKETLTITTASNMTTTTLTIVETPGTMCTNYMTCIFTLSKPENDNRSRAVVPCLPYTLQSQYPEGTVEDVVGVTNLEPQHMDPV